MQVNHSHNGYRIPSEKRHTLQESNEVFADNWPSAQLLFIYFEQHKKLYIIFFRQIV